MASTTKTSVRPKLAVKTPVTASFPREVLAAVSSATEIRSSISLPSASVSDRTPLSSISRTSAYRDPLFSAGLPSAGLPSAGLPSARSFGFTSNGPMSAGLKPSTISEEKTLITPPVGYLEFLRGTPCRPSSPAVRKMKISRTSTTTSASSEASTESSVSDSTNVSNGFDEEEDSADKQVPEVDSALSSATSVSTADHCESHQEQESPALPPAPSALGSARRPKIPFSPAVNSPKYPMSAPPTGAAAFPSIKVAPSPTVLGRAGGGLNSPMPQSPFSAASTKSYFDWDAALKYRRFTESATTGDNSGGSKSKPTTPVAGTKRDSRTNTNTNTTRQIREVFTRTVTYTPRMAPAPKGKRRKVDHETAVES